MRRRNSQRGITVTAFGAGLFLAYCFPGKFIIITLAVLLIAAGILILRAG